MDTLIKFRQKNFAGVARNVVKYIKTPQGIISTAGVTLAGANLATNLSRHNKDRDFQEKQLKAMNNLSGTLGKFNGTMEKSMAQQKELMAQQAASSNKLVAVPQSQQKKSGFTLFRLRK